MPRADEPRVTFRVAASDFAVLEAAASAVNVSVGALARECAVRYAGEMAREVSAGRVSLRRRSAAAPSAPVPSSTAPVKRRASARVLPPGVTTARDLMMDRQRKLNERRP